jgi:hypothetical protein
MTKEMTLYDKRLYGNFIKWMGFIGMLAVVAVYIAAFVAFPQLFDSKNLPTSVTDFTGVVFGIVLFFVFLWIVGGFMNGEYHDARNDSVAAELTALREVRTAIEESRDYQRYAPLIAAYRNGYTDIPVTQEDRERLVDEYIDEFIEDLP